METYVIAVKRDKRGVITLPEALERIRDIEDVRILDDSAEYIARVSATDQSIREVVARLSILCHIEAGIDHHPQAAIRRPPSAERCSAESCSAESCSAESCSADACSAE